MLPWLRHTNWRFQSRLMYFCGIYPCWTCQVVSPASNCVCVCVYIQYIYSLKLTPSVRQHTNINAVVSYCIAIAIALSRSIMSLSSLSQLFVVLLFIIIRWIDDLSTHTLSPYSLERRGEECRGEEEILRGLKSWERNLKQTSFIDNVLNFSCFSLQRCVLIQMHSSRNFSSVK